MPALHLFFKKKSASPHVLAHAVDMHSCRTSDCMERAFNAPSGFGSIFVSGADSEKILEQNQISVKKNLLSR